MKKLFLIAIAGILCFSIASSDAYAGKSRRNMYEGIAIGLGAAILGGALLNHYQPRYAPENTYCYPPPRPQRYGYWGYKKIWVPPVYNRVWNPGHYSYRGQWIPGGWVKIKARQGHWSRTRSWISRR